MAYACSPCFAPKDEETYDGRAKEKAGRWLPQHRQESEEGEVP